MSDEESGGVQGLRAWAADATGRVRSLLPALGAAPAPPRVYDASITELGELERLLGHDPGLRSTVNVWLAAALAQRRFAGGGAPDDRVRAESLLRDVRDPGTALGAAATEEDRRWAALFLLPLVSPWQFQPGFGEAVDLSAYLEWVSRAGYAGMANVAVEMDGLMADVVELPLPSEFLDQLRRLRGFYAAPDRAGLSDLLTGILPAGDPYADQLRHMMERMWGMAGPPTDTPAPAPPHPSTPAPEPPTASKGRAHPEPPTDSEPPTGSEGPAVPKRPPGSEGPVEPEPPADREGRMDFEPPTDPEGRVDSEPHAHSEGSADPKPPTDSEGRAAPKPPTDPERLTGRERPVEPEQPTDRGRRMGSEPPTDSEGPAAPKPPTDPERPTGRERPVDPEQPTDREGRMDFEPPTDSEGPAAPKPPTDPEPPTGPALTADGLRRLAAAMDAVHATTYGLDDVLKSEDPHRAVNELLRRLRSVQDQPPPGPDPTSALESLRALLLNISPGAGGAHQDRLAGRAHMDAILHYFGNLQGSLPPGIGDPAVLGRALQLYSRVMDAGEAEDVQALRDLVDEAEALEKAVPEGHSFRFVVLLSLGAAYGRLGVATQDNELLLRSLPYLEKGASGVRESGLPFAREMPLPRIPHFDLLRAALTEDRTAPLPEHVPPPPGASTEELHTAALSLGVRYSLTRDRAELGTLIDELERVRDGVREGRAPRIAADALWQLAQAYRERGVRNDDVKDIAALEAAKESLTALAADVLLQAGAEHGLLTARSGASRGVQAALWAASQGRLHETVAALELGRALVLQAASTSSAVPELLDAGGYHELAEAWRTVGASQGPGTADEGGVPGELPSRLRRQALEALGYRRADGLLATPTLSELADGLAESGADALVYLVPGDDADAGVVLVLAPRLGVRMWVQSLLSGAENGPLERYLDATDVRDAAARDGRRSDPSAEQAWEEALTALCDWAHQVIGPVLADVEERLAADGDRADGPLRLVLVPCGRLGIVPWHAARLPDDAPHDYLCQTAVVSYAASGSQFLRTVGRAPRDPAAAPVLLADPNLGLTHAEVEVTALRDAFYRRARMCGGLFGVPDEELVPGTPDDVLAFLADGASLLHVASHGSAGTRPTVSALHLAAPEPAGDQPVGDESTAPDPGHLTVTRLLDRPDTQLGADDGPLVVLSACQTDLSTRDHDEALTLTTAFVAGGARDVVGSRWTTQDSASALLMAVFHHHLTVEGMSPVDALRAAQLWMLDPRRENPGSLSGELLRRMERPDLDRIALWAAFIHQGHPGPAETRTGTEGGNA